jgi:hypothetical protein
MLLRYLQILDSTLSGISIIVMLVVILIWWAGTVNNPYELMCSNCNAKTTGNPGTFLLRIHWFNKVLMTCPSCGELSWLTAIGKIRS